MEGRGSKPPEIQPQLKKAQGRESLPKASSTTALRKDSLTGSKGRMQE